MSQFLKLISNILFLGCFICGCSNQPQRVPTNIPEIDLAPLTIGILLSEEINESHLLKVDNGLIISDRSNCMPKDCAFSIWDILEQDSLTYCFQFNATTCNITEKFSDTRGRKLECRKDNEGKRRAAWHSDARNPC